MKRPNVYICEAFLEEMDKRLALFKENQDRIFIPKERKVLERVLNLLLSSNLNSDLSEKDMIKLYKSSMGNKEYNSIQKLVYLSSIKEGRLNHNQEYLQTNNLIQNKLIEHTKDFSGCYFLSCQNEECKEFSQMFGMIA